MEEPKKEGTRRRNSKLESKGCKSSKFCKYCGKPAHLVVKCYKLKNKEEKEEENNQSTEASVVDLGYNGDVLLATATSIISATKWVLDFGYIFCMYPTGIDFQHMTYWIHVSLSWAMMPNAMFLELTLFRLKPTMVC